MARIKKKRLEEIGFTQNVEESTDTDKVFDNREFRVTLMKGREDNPIVSIKTPVLESEDVLETWVAFPGVYTMKHLRDLIFFYLGENGCAEFCKDFPTRIIKESKNKIDNDQYVEMYFKFVDWTKTNCSSMGNGRWVYDGLPYSLEELLKIFKKTGVSRKS